MSTEYSQYDRILSCQPDSSAEFRDDRPKEIHQRDRSYEDLDADDKTLNEESRFKYNALILQSVEQIIDTIKSYSASLQPMKHLVAIKVGSPACIGADAYWRTLAWYTVLFKLREPLEELNQQAQISQPMMPYIYNVLPPNNAEEMFFIGKHNTVVMDLGVDPWSLVKDDTVLFIPTIPIENTPPGLLVRPSNQTPAFISLRYPRAIICADLKQWIKAPRKNDVVRSSWDGVYISHILSSYYAVQIGHLWAFKGCVLYAKIPDNPPVSMAFHPGPQTNQIATFKELHHHEGLRWLQTLASENIFSYLPAGRQRSIPTADTLICFGISSYPSPECGLVAENVKKFLLLNLAQIKLKAAIELPHEAVKLPTFVQAGPFDDSQGDFLKRFGIDRVIGDDALWEKVNETTFLMLLGYDLRLVPTGLVFDSLAFHRLESQNDRFPVTIRSDFTNRMPLGIICKDLSNIFDLLESSVLLHYTAYPLITIEKCRYFIYIRNQWAVDGQLPYNHKLEMKHEFEDRITAPIFAEESSSSTAVEELG